MSQAVSIAVSAPGKVILHGEHSVVYGKLAIAGSLDLRTKIKLVEVEQQRKIGIELRALDLSQSYNLDSILIDLSKHPLPLLKPTSYFNIEHPEFLNHDALLKFIENFIQTYTKDTTLNYFKQLSLTTIFYLFHSMTASVDLTIKPFNLLIETDLTVSGGTGSSASFCVCVAAIFYHYIRVKLANSDNNISKKTFKSCILNSVDLKKFEKSELDLISKWAYCAERIIHGTPSGVDNTVCTYGSLVEFCKANGAKQLNIPLKFKILLINTNVQKDTKVMVKRVSGLKERHGGVVEAIFEALDAVAKEALECFKCLNREFLRIDTFKEQQLIVAELYERLGELTDINQNLLATLNVSHPKLDQICATIKEFGLHGKLTGAGGGGYAFALIPPYFDETNLNSLKNRLILDGFDALVTDLGGPGVAVDL